MVITPDWLWGDVGSNPAQGKLSFKHLFQKKGEDYLGCAVSGFLSKYIYITADSTVSAFWASSVQC